jgi:pyruvate dehydrogenase E2 component (dihydrolipoamide acetyltransferase)
MPTNVIMPALGMNQVTGTLVRWLREEGEQVQAGEPLMEVETDKTTVEVEATASGVLMAVAARPGDEVPVGGTIAVILAPGETLSGGTEIDRARPPTQLSDPYVPVVTPEPEGSALTGAAPSSPRVLASPRARRRAAELGVNLVAIVGTGPDGSVQTSDVEHAATSASRTSHGSHGQPTSAGHVETAPISQTWRTMSERITQSWTGTPHIFLSREVDASSLQGWRQTFRDAHVTITDLLVRLAAVTLRRHPRFNSSWSPSEIRLHHDVNVGVAVAIDDGIVVPVIKRADELDVVSIARQRVELVDRARQGRLRLEEVAHATFTVSNLGMYGVDSFTAIINPPQAAILAVGAVADRPASVGGQLRLAPTMRLTLSVDHRVADGAMAARFLATFATMVADPRLSDA